MAIILAFFVPTGATNFQGETLSGRVKCTVEEKFVIVIVTVVAVYIGNGTT